MSFFKKIKQGLGIGTAKIEMDVPEYIREDTKEVDGKLTLTAKSDQKVKTIKVSLVEMSMVGSGDDRHEVRKNIHTTLVSEAFEIKEDEVRTFPFKLSVDLGNKASFDLFGGKLEISASSGTPQNLMIVAIADLEGVAVDPTAAQDVKFTV